MSILPLYQHGADAPGNPGDGHLGLWFDKFCNVWKRNGSTWGLSAPTGRNRDDDTARESPKSTWIETVTGTPVGLLKQLEEYRRRMLRLVRSRQGSFWVMRADSRFVTGLGRRHPIENGFAWHPTLGTPYLPGSSIKGMIRAWGQAEGEDVDRILGSPGKVGRVALLDALPTAPVTLESDVMTPHYGGWAKDDPPGDWRSPNPIPFLTAARGTKLLFAAVPAANATSEQDVVSDLEKVATWLKDALTWQGAGAKTAVGYGRFSYDHAETDRLANDLAKEEQVEADERRREQLSATPEGRWQVRLEEMSEQEILAEAKRFTEGEGPVDQDDARAFARAVAELGYLSEWTRGQRRDPETVLNEKKLKQRANKLRRLVDGSPSSSG